MALVKGDRVNAGPAVAIVTGASGAIGSVIATRLAADGFHVVGVDQRDGGLAGPGIESLTADVATTSGRRRAIATAVSRGTLAGLVNCAGVVPTTAPLEISVEEWNTTLSVNVVAAYEMCRLAAADMMTRGAGSIVNIGSVAGSRPSPANLVYGASKAALASVGTSLAAALAPHGIRVNTVCPGLIDTPLTAQTDLRLAETTGRSVEQVRADRRDAVPLQRLGATDEVADLVAYLISDRAGYITGQAVHVNGGSVMTA